MNHIEAMKQALEIGQKILANVNLDNLDIVDDLVDSNASLRQALEQQPAAWVGLTDEEKASIFYENNQHGLSWLKTLDALEAKLKEKNA